MERGGQRLEGLSSHKEQGERRASDIVQNATWPEGLSSWDCQIGMDMRDVGARRIERCCCWHSLR
eukprot:scaffold309898_cov19-Tisochrysis_lutea.AAC.1